MVARAGGASSALGLIQVAPRLFWQWVRGIASREVFMLRVGEVSAESNLAEYASKHAETASRVLRLRWRYPTPPGVLHSTNGDGLSRFPVLCNAGRPSRRRLQAAEIKYVSI